jgi:putative oxidoreductase
MNTKRLKDATMLSSRIILGVVIGAHGAQKALGWFGGFGFDSTMDYFSGTLGIPYFLAFLVVLAESAGMLALIFGLTTRLVAMALIPVMIGAIVTSHLQFGFFMNWFGSQPGEGFEFHLLVIGLAALITVNGAGAYSLDAMLRSRLTNTFVGRRILFG